MTVPLMLDLGSRRMNPPADTLAWAAFRQLTLVRAALRLHRQYMASGEVQSTATFASTGMYSEINSGAIISNLMRRGAPTTVEGQSALIEEAQFPGAAAEMAARGFVYELAVFRNMVRAIGLTCPNPQAAEGALAAFDAAVPDLVPLRDTLAHLDERFRGLARGRSINAQPTTAQGETMDLGLLHERERIGAHAADGSFRRVEVSDSTLAAATALFQTVTGLFPRNPDAA